MKDEHGTENSELGAQKSNPNNFLDRHRPLGVAALLVVGVCVGVIISEVRAPLQTPSLDTPQSANAPTGTITAPSTERPADIELEEAYRQLTGVPPTLTALAQSLASSGDSALVESLRLAAEANGVLHNPIGNSETAALLSIRALRSAYSQEADTTLTQALHQLRTQRAFPGFLAVAFSPDGRYLLTERRNDAVLYDIMTGEPVQSFIGHTSALQTLAFSADGQFIFTASWDRTARIWNRVTGETLDTLRFPNRETVRDVDFSPDGRYILTSDGDVTQLWDMRTDELHNIILENGMLAGAFSPDGQTFVTAGLDGVIRVWETANTRRMLRELRTSLTLPHTITFSPDGKFLLTGGRNSPASLWDVETGALVQAFSNYSGDVRAAVFSPDAQFVLTTQGEIAQLWQTSSGSLVRTFSGHTVMINGLAFSPDGNYILTASSDRSSRLWNVNAEPLPRMNYQDNGGIIAIFSPDGRYVLNADPEDFTLLLRDIATGEVIRPFVGHRGTVLTAEFSADGQRILSRTFSSSVRLWDVQTGSMLREFAPDAQLAEARLSADGRFVVTSDYDNRAQLWDVASGEPLQTFVGHTQPVLAVDISPDSQYVLTGSRDKTAILWNAVTGEVLRTFTAHTGEIQSVSFNPDGARFVTASEDRTALLWETATGNLLRTFSDHGERLSAATFNPDGRLLLTRSTDGFLRIWDVETGVLVRVISGFLYKASADVFSPDGRFVMGWSLDGTSQVWDTDPRDFINYACSRVFRDFSFGVEGVYANERALYRIPEFEATCPRSRASDSTPPFPPTSTSIPTAMIPMWTQIVSPTPSEMPTQRPTYTPFPTLLPSATPNRVSVAQIGENRGEIPIGGGQVWTYVREPDERLTITLKADNPANNAQDRTGLLDAFMLIYSPDGTLYSEVDDINPGIVTDSRVENFWLPVAGEIRIEVRSFGDQSGGGYTLVIESRRVENYSYTPIATVSP